MAGYQHSGPSTQWRHQKETFSALLAFCAENSPVACEFPLQRPVTRSYDVSLICTWRNGWVSNRDAGDLRRHRAYCDVTVMNGFWETLMFHLYALRSRRNGHGGVSNHQPHHCLLNRLFGCRSKKTSKLCVTGLCAGNSPGTGEFPAQMASNAENVSIWWRHHDYTLKIRYTVLALLCIVLV